MPSLEKQQVLLLERREVQQQRRLAVAHCSHVALTLLAASHNCTSDHLCDHHENVCDRVNDGGDVSVYGRGGRENGFDGDLGRRCRRNGFDSVALRGDLLLRGDDALLVCSSGVD